MLAPRYSLSFTAVLVAMSIGSLAIADDRHGFDSDALAQEHGISSSPRSDDKFEILRSQGSDRSSSLETGYQNRSGATTFVDSTGGAVNPPDASAWWAQMKAECEANDKAWDPDSRSCIDPFRACTQMGFDWEGSASNGRCLVGQGSLDGSPQSQSPQPGEPGWVYRVNNTIYNCSWSSPQHSHTCNSGDATTLSRSNSGNDDYDLICRCN